MKKSFLLAVCIIFAAGLASAQSSLPGVETCASKAQKCRNNCGGNKNGRAACQRNCTEVGQACERMQAAQAATNKGKITPPRSVGTSIP